MPPISMNWSTLQVIFVIVHPTILQSQVLGNFNVIICSLFRCNFMSWSRKILLLDFQHRWWNSTWNITLLAASIYSLLVELKLELNLACVFVKALIASNSVLLCVYVGVVIPTLLPSITAYIEIQCQQQRLFHSYEPRVPSLSEDCTKLRNIPGLSFSRVFLLVTLKEKCLGNELHEEGQAMTDEKLYESIPT